MASEVRGAKRQTDDMGTPDNSAINTKGLKARPLKWRTSRRYREIESARPLEEHASDDYAADELSRPRYLIAVEGPARARGHR